MLASASASVDVREDPGHAEWPPKPRMSGAGLPSGRLPAWSTEYSGPAQRPCTLLFLKIVPGYIDTDLPFWLKHCGSRRDGDVRFECRGCE